ncbi:amp dependent CoA ligase [Laetiporus sulphureus 93-53]|uniref:Amp dependent CoA ligase n=1 Tax=Laetiporus sulphureus 93-53 TaxID=1314785 RepID=A0A165F1Q4_9APHY|nr:amp dependent CoA ligase [Laetiporus sulphureus 93-53]KZT08187.1 amp dependent CoA ligase [Laetiporus sulphureus 93-53]
MSKTQSPDSPQIPHIPDDLTMVQFMLDGHAAKRPDYPWLIDDVSGRGYTLTEIRSRVDGLATAMKSRWNIQEDDVVCICSPNHLDFPVAIWAIHRLSAIVTAANPMYTVEELEHQLLITKAKLVIVHSSSYSTVIMAARTARLSPDHIVMMDEARDMEHAHLTVEGLIQEGDSVPRFNERHLNKCEGRTKLAFINLSSGTTAKPKAVGIPHTAMIASVTLMMQWASSQTSDPQERMLRPGDKWMALLPFYHIAGLMVVLHFGLYFGATLVVVPKFNLTRMLKSIQRHQIHILPVAPPTVVLLCKDREVSQYDLRSLRLVMSGGAPLSAELMQQFFVVFPWAGIGQIYGMTETVIPITMPNLQQKMGTPGNAGCVLPGMMTRVVRPDGSFGHWIYTGDEVIINTHNEIFILDRIKELLKVKGYQVAPAELEGHLLNQPDVSDACVVGLPDEYSGEVPVAFVVPSASALELMQNDSQAAKRIKAAIMKHVADAKVHYKWLATVKFIDEIPKNPSGKLLRRVLRDHARQMQSNGELVLAIRAKM